jgi:putative transposase
MGNRALARGPAARRDAYRELCRTGPDEETLEDIRLATNGGFVLGNRRFQEEVARMLGRRVTRGKPGRPSVRSRVDERQRDLFGSTARARD